MVPDKKLTLVDYQNSQVRNYSQCNWKKTTLKLVEWLADKHQVPVPIVRYYEENLQCETREGVEGYYVNRLPILHIYQHATMDKDLILAHEFWHYFLDTLGSKRSVMENTSAVEDFVQGEAELDLAEFRAAS